MKTNTLPEKHVFTQYQIFLIAIIAIIQFSVILDFMVLSPLGVILLKDLQIKTTQFGWVVSVYAFSAGIAGLLAAGFADKYDRKILLLFFYCGFITGTLLCAIASTYEFLLVARIITGLFGGVIGSISMAIITDLFKMEIRGRVMGFVQMAFAASQVLGIPVGLWLANRYGWHSPFWMIAAFSAIVCIIIFIYLKPVKEHLNYKTDLNPIDHLIATISNKNYLKGFLATSLLATGGFMLMPFGSAFSINNLKIPMEYLPLLYGVTGVFTIIFGPLLGKLSDKTGKYRLFVIGSVLSILMVAVYTNLGPTPLWMVMVLNVILFVGITSRMISASALMTAIPTQQYRGAFMSINSSIQQISGGIAAAGAGMIVVQSNSGELLHYPALGLVVIVSMLITIVLMYILNEQVQKNKNVSSISKI
ncbi:MAG: MFS transporter [Bacteroidia bacterium]|nr:MFS transporter [Bacteroidia bacterium]